MAFRVTGLAAAVDSKTISTGECWCNYVFVLFRFIWFDFLLSVFRFFIVNDSIEAQFYFTISSRPTKMCRFDFHGVAWMQIELQSSKWQTWKCGVRMTLSSWKELANFSKMHQLTWTLKFYSIDVIQIAISARSSWNSKSRTFAKTSMFQDQLSTTISRDSSLKLQIVHSWKEITLSAVKPWFQLPCWRLCHSRIAVGRSKWPQQRLKHQNLSPVIHMKSPSPNVASERTRKTKINLTLSHLAQLAHRVQHSRWASSRVDHEWDPSSTVETTATFQQS